MPVFEYAITPIPKPRMTRSDKWMKRKCVMQYWAFKDEINSLKVRVNPDGCKITFVLPMPESWSKKKKTDMNGQPHRQKPDVDNLIKALCDALYDDDAHVWNIHISKVWGTQGMIIIEPMEEVSHGRN